MTQLEIFISECQTKAEQGIANMESYILSSFEALYTGPRKNDITLKLDEIDLTIPTNIPPIGSFTLSNITYKDFAPHRTAMWQGDYMASIQTLLSQTITNGGIGLSQTLQDSIFNSDRERKLLALNDALRMIDAGHGAKGFRMPTDYLAGQRQEAILKYQYDLENQSREITKLMEEHARTNWQFCVQNGISAEEFQARFTESYDKLVSDMAVASITLYRAQLDAQLAEYKAKAESIMLQWQVVGEKLKAGSVKLNAQVESFKAQIQTETAAAQVKVQGHASEAQRVSAAYKAYADLVMSFAQTASAGAISVNQ